jgi:hypothetical protein
MGKHISLLGWTDIAHGLLVLAGGDPVCPAKIASSCDGGFDRALMFGLVEAMASSNALALTTLSLLFGS